MTKPIKPVGKAAIPLFSVDPRSGWFELQQVDLTQIPQLAVYWVRLVDIGGSPISISRMLGNDDCGLLYIGRTQSTTSFRIADLLEDLKSPNARPKHGIGKKFWDTRFLDRLRNGERCQVGWDALTSYLDKSGKEVADIIRERDLLQGYFKLYAELPPFNRVLPGFLKDRK